LVLPRKRLTVIPSRRLSIAHLLSHEDAVHRTHVPATAGGDRPGAEGDELGFSAIPMGGV
jgi:hypothetical protein